MSRTKRDTQRIMHWCKNGDLVLKNKIKDTILRENLHEERFLDSTLSSLNKHQSEEQKHLVNKRLQFEKRKQRSSSLDRSDLHGPHAEHERNRSFSDEAVHSKSHQNSRKSFSAKAKWQKAISTVRFAVRSKSGEKKTRAKPKATAVLPRIVQSRPKSKLSCTGHASKNNHLALPRIPSASTGNINCLEDPRFLRLQQILSLGEEKDEEGDQKSSRKTSREEDEYGMSNTWRSRSHTYHL